MYEASGGSLPLEVSPSPRKPPNSPKPAFDEKKFKLMVKKLKS